MNVLGAPLKLNAILIIQQFIVLSLVFLTSFGEELLQTVTDEVFGGNYTYYQIRSRGRLRLELVSLTGDADLYVSDSEPHPSEENYDVKSFTCGIDSVELSSSLKRPVAVGIFGHPFFSTSKYSLSVFKLPEEEEVDYATLDALYNDYKEDVPETEQQQQTSVNDYKSRDHPEEESTLWTVAITILKILFDILL